ncbi:hypothetical protein D9M68_754630 [compost metagenome]
MEGGRRGGLSARGQPLQPGGIEHGDAAIALGNQPGHFPRLQHLIDALARGADQLCQQLLRQPQFDADALRRVGAVRACQRQ